MSSTYGFFASLVALILILAVAMTGCYVPHGYLVSPEAVALARSSDPPYSVPAERAKDGKAVQVRTSTLQLETVRPEGGKLWVRSRAYSKTLADANGLTWFGTVASIAGGIMIVLGYAAGVEGLKLPGVFFAPMSEPFMISGTVLWVRGAKSHPQEVGDEPAPLRVSTSGPGITF